MRIAATKPSTQHPTAREVGMNSSTGPTSARYLAKRGSLVCGGYRISVALGCRSGCDGRMSPHSKVSERLDLGGQLGEVGCTLLRKRRGRCSEESGRSYIEHRERGPLYKCSVTVSALATGPSVLCNPGTVQMRGCEDARMRGCRWCGDDRCSGESGRRRELGQSREATRQATGQTHLQGRQPAPSRA